MWPHSNNFDEQKHETILPAARHVTSIIVTYFHEKKHQSGGDQTLASVREEFWKTNDKSVVRRIANNCLLCQRLKVTPKPHFMSNLPAERLAIYEPAFHCIGLDYFDPIIAKNQRQIQTAKMLWCSLYMFNYNSSAFRSCGDLRTNSFFLALR